MPVPTDPDAKLAAYAHPERLVTTSWLAEHLDDPGLVVVESDEDVLLYETGHVPGAVKVDWHTELNDPVVRDYVDGAGFSRLLSAKGISREEAYSLVQKHALETWESFSQGSTAVTGFEERVRGDSEISKLLSAAEIDGCFSIKKHLEHVDFIFKRVFGG